MSVKHSARSYLHLRRKIVDPIRKRCPKTQNQKLINLLISLILTFSPQDDDDAIENIEAVGDVSKRSFGNHLQQHLDGKNARKYNVAGLDDCGEFGRLVVVLDAHRQRID